MEPKDPNTQLVEQTTEKATALYEAGRYREALAMVNCALELSPKDVDAWGIRHIIYMELERYEEAIADANRALELNHLDDEGRFLLYLGRGDCYRLLGHYEEAVADVNRALELNPDDEDALVIREEIKQAITTHSQPSTNRELQWEYAEVKWETHYPYFIGEMLHNTLTQDQYRLEAIAMGPNGRYHLAYSPHFTSRANIGRGGGAVDGEDALSTLSYELSQDGWEPQPGGDLWWQARFRRPVQS